MQNAENNFLKIYFLSSQLSGKVKQYDEQKRQNSWSTVKISLWWKLGKEFIIRKGIIKSKIGS